MKKIKSIQGLRALCFIQIFFAHTCYLNNKEHLAWFTTVPWALELFFMISGFGIVLGYDNKLPTIKNQPSEWCNFVFKRLKKIYFLHIVALFVSVVYVILQIFLNDYSIKLEQAVIAFIAQLFLVQSWIPSMKIIEMFNGLTWFMSSLFFSYFLSIPSLYFLKKVKNYRVLALLLIIIKLAFGAIHLNQYWIHVWPIARYSDFFLGMIVAKCFLSEEEVSNTSFKQYLSLVGMVIMISFCSFYYTSDIQFIHPDSLLAISCFFFVLFLPYDGPIGKILGKSLLVWIGNISMELYLIHGFVIRYLWSLWSMLGFSLNFYLVAIEFIVSLVLAVLWNTFVTKRFYNKN